ncbi:MAG TPA: alanine racemase [Candidatus Limnocylindrales bacterium]|nr:alanine racemase [Candidatus Limnocylindrales bacterium]
MPPGPDDPTEAPESTEAPEPIERRLERADLAPLRRTAWIEVDLGALAGNVAALRRMAGAGVRVLPVVKADAYGHGMVPVARALEAAGVDGLCVATLDEAVALIDAGVRAPLLVLYPVPVDAVGDAARLGIGLAGGSTDGLSRLLERAAADGVADRLSIELEIESGLGRGGVEPEGAVAAAREIVERGARLGGVWSHLQEAEVADLTERQVARFEDALGRLAAAGIRPPRRHLAASAAILLGAVPTYDAVRPGLTTYGLIPDELAAAGIGLDRLHPAARDLRPILSLHARPVRVAELPEGHGVSYGPTWRAPVESRIATLPLGYGDGWPRSLSNRAEVLVRGVRAPVVGNVAMDATMVDVSRVPGPPVGLDDEFVLLGAQGDAEIAAGEVARWRTTNSWEVVTSMSARLARVYDAPTGLLGARRLGQMEDSWLASSSGTGISATSRSTRS